MNSLSPVRSLRSQVVLLKPNLISHKAPRLGCTNGQFIAGVAQWFLDHGARVKLGDSPAFGNTKKVCELQSITEELHGLDVELVEFVTPEKKTLPCDTEIFVAQEAFDCDLLVGLPKLKAHNQLYVTMAVKNLFGLVVGTKKPLLHMVEGSTHDRFAEIILGLETLISNQVHIIDGVEAMHEAGPMNGVKLNLGLVGGALSPVALDTALLHALNLRPENSPIWRVARRREYLESDRENLRYPCMGPHSFTVSKFVAPLHLTPVRFNPLRFMYGIAKRLLGGKQRAGTNSSHPN